MDELLLVEWLTSSLDEARKITASLIEKGYVACANINPHVISKYVWKGKIEEDNEVQVFFKTRKKFFQPILKWIQENGSYEVPAVLAFSISEVNPDYARWVCDICP